MTQEKTIQQLEKALEQNNQLYNKLGTGEWTLKKAGKVYDQLVGYKTIQALSLALVELKAQKRKAKNNVKLRAWHIEQKRWATHEELLSEIPVSASVNGRVLTFGSEEWEIHIIAEGEN